MLAIKVTVWGSRVVLLDRIVVEVFGQLMLFLTNVGDVDTAQVRLVVSIATKETAEVKVSGELMMIDVNVLVILLDLVEELVKDDLRILDNVF